ncbi:hypothetical protein POTOM_007892 [Populus tomentosa]|uniref:Uncharacterized protein n=1 Tax=Populus tomentosa TaxID=118781 RepID=A0A8X8DC43_POPTO|nr:hypothetical protein POTOM_007892 [Populus tomentosa]
MYIGIADYTFSITLLTKASNSNSWLLPAHNQIRMMLGHDLFKILVLLRAPAEINLRLCCFSFSRKKGKPGETSALYDFILFFNLVPKKHHWTLHQAVLGFMAKDPIQVVLLVESATGASYKAHGVNGRKYLLPALFDPSTSTVLLLFISINRFSSAARRLSVSDQTQEPFLFQYHNGPLLTGQISVNLIWYGKFRPSQRAIVSDFIDSVSSRKLITAQPSVATWWKATEKYFNLVKPKKTSPPLFSLGTQILDEKYSLGKSLSGKQIVQLASKGGQKDAINVVLTSSDVAVEGFCSSKCGLHGSSLSVKRINRKISKFAYIWVGNSETQCPGQCAWPLHQPIYGPQNPPLVAPNNDVGLDGMVINLASLLAGTATNPFGNGYFQGPKEAPLEAASACPGVYGKGAYPGYAGDLLVDSTTGASYNAHGVNGRKYLLPALFDPSTSTCSTLP